MEPAFPRLSSMPRRLDWKLLSAKPEADSVAFVNKPSMSDKGSL